MTPIYKNPKWLSLFDEFETRKSFLGKVKLKDFCAEKGIDYATVRVYFSRIRKARGVPKELSEGIQNFKEFKKKQGVGTFCNTAKKSYETRGGKNEKKGVTNNDAEVEFVSNVALLPKPPPQIFDVSWLSDRHVAQILSIESATADLIQQIGLACGKDVADSGQILQLSNSLSKLLDLNKEVYSQLRGVAQKVQSADILRQCKNGEMNALQASLAFEELGLPIPKTVQLVLSRMEIPKPKDNDDGIPDDILDASTVQAIEDIKEQVEKFVPERREEIRKLKEESEKAGRESFAPGREET